MDRKWTFDHGNPEVSAGRTQSERLTVRYTQDVSDGVGSGTDLREQVPTMSVGVGCCRLNVARKRTFDHGTRTGHMGQSERRYNPLSWPAVTAALITLAVVAFVVAWAAGWLS